MARKTNYRRQRARDAGGAAVARWALGCIYNVHCHSITWPVGCYSMCNAQLDGVVNSDDDVDDAS